MTAAPDRQPDWRASVVAYIRAEAQPVDKFGHQPRLYALAARIAESSPCDDDVLFAAAWMHDLGVFVGHRPSDPQKLAGWGFPAGKLDAVAEVIRTHQPKDEPRAAEAVVLRDADILEQLGAIGALRALVKIGRDTRFATFTDVVPVLERALANLPGRLRLATSRALAEDRVAVLGQLIEAIRREGGELLY